VLTTFSLKNCLWYFDGDFIATGLKTAMTFIIELGKNPKIHIEMRKQLNSQSNLEQKEQT
jgi:hypothetical protein